MVKLRVTIMIFLFIVLLGDIGYCEETLAKGCLIGGSIGPTLLPFFGLDFLIEGPSLGVGSSSSPKNGFLISVKGFEFGTSGFAGDYTFLASAAPVYIYFTSGLHSGKKMIEPVYYIYGGGNFWYVGFDMVYLQLGCGVKWTYWVVSQGIEAAWRTVWLEGQSSNIFSIKATLELGGWWGLRQK